MLDLAIESCPVVQAGNAKLQAGVRKHCEDCTMLMLGTV